MTDTLLVLGGSGFVGPAVVQAGLERGFEVTTFHRSAEGSRPPGVDWIQGDRLEPASLEPLRARHWDATILAAGIEPWTELPIWLPADHEYAAMHDSDVGRALAAGLSCRPVLSTVRDTWRWMSGLPGPPALRRDVVPAGLSPEREREVLLR